MSGAAPDREALLRAIVRAIRSIPQSIRVSLDAPGYHAAVELPPQPTGPPGPGEVQPAPQPAQPEAPDSSGCRADVLDALRAAGHRMTTTQLLAALERADKVWGESTVRMALARMVDSGELTNRSDVRPRGYGLPEWG